MLKALVYLFLAGGVLYLLFYPFLRHSVNRKKLFKWFLIAYGVIMVLSTAGAYLTDEEQPESFEAGVALVRQDPEITAEIGAFKSLKFHKKDLPQESDNPAELKFELEGSKGTLPIESRVEKDSAGNWHVVTLRKGILVEKYE